MKIGIVGSRKYEDKIKIKDFIYKVKNSYGSSAIIVSGACRNGADRYAKKYALELGLGYEEYPPFHETHSLYCPLPEHLYGKPYSVKHFFVRNKQIAKSSDVVAAFIPDGEESPGSRSTLNYAKKFKKKTIIIS